MTVALPGVVVAVTRPGDELLSVAPAGIVVVAVVSVQQVVLLRASVIVMALGAATGAPALS